MDPGEAGGKLTGAGGSLSPALAAIAVTVAKQKAWAWLRNYLIRGGYARAGDFLEQGPSGNVSIDESRLPERETDDELRERMREAFRRAMEEYRGD